MGSKKAIKIIVFLSLIVLISSGLGGMVQGKEIKKVHMRYGTFEGLKFNNRRIILEIKEDGSGVIKSAKTGKILVEKVYPLVEIKKEGKWKGIKFENIKIRERNWKNWHIVKIKMLHRGKIKVKVILRYVEKHRFRRHRPLYPEMWVRFSKRVRYRITWCYDGVHIKNFEVIDNGSGETKAPYRSGHGRVVLYNGTIEKNMTFDRGQDILRGYANKKLQMGFNWEMEKNNYTVLKFIEEAHRSGRRLDIRIEPRREPIWDGEVVGYRPPIPDSGGGGSDSDGDGLYDAIEEAGWDVTWYDAEGHAHTEHVTSDPHSKDTDGDGLSDYEEWKLGTDPRNTDTDGDGLSDYKETKTLETSPLKADTDGDGLTDYMEVHGWYVWSEGKWVTSDPNFRDTDGDGLTDYKEWELDTNPRSVDTDGDGILDKFDKYPTIKDDEKPKMDVPHIYASNGKWWIKNLYVEDNAEVAKVTVLYYDGGNLDDQWSKSIYAAHAWINTSVKDNIWDYVTGNKIKIIVTDINGNQVTYSYSHDLYTDLASIWNKISKFISGAIINAVKNLISAYPDLAPLIALGWALGESLWSNSIGGLIDMARNPGKFVDGIKSFINALKSNGVMNTITAVLDGIKEEIESKVNTLVSYISDTTKRNEVRQQCFNMFVVGEIIGFVVAMAIQPDGFPTGLSKFIEKLGNSGSKLAQAFGKIANTIEKMKSLLRDVKSLALGKLMEKSSALKAAVKELVQSGKMSEKTKDLMNRVAQWFGKDGVSREEKVIDDVAEKLDNGAKAEDLKEALEDIKEDRGIAGKPDKERKLIDAEEQAIKEVGLTGEKAKIFHEVLRRGLVSEADKTDAEFLKKVARYIKYSEDNPLNAGEKTVVRFMKAKEVTTKVNGESIEGFAVLRKGYYDKGIDRGLGWEKIRKKHGEEIKKALGLSDDESIKKVIEDTLIEGKKDPNDQWAYIKYYYIQKDDGLHVYQLRVIISDNPNRAGWVIDSYVKRIK